MSNSSSFQSKCYRGGIKRSFPTTWQCGSIQIFPVSNANQEDLFAVKLIQQILHVLSRLTF